MQASNTIVALILVFCLNQWAWGQQLPLFSQYRENQSIINPAALNIDFIRNDYNFSAGISRRNQWSATKLLLDNGSTLNFGPSTTTGRVEWIFPEDRFFVGGYVMKDEAGAIELTGLYLRAGYLIIDPEEYSFGLVGSINGGFNQFRVDYTSGGLSQYTTQYTDGAAGPGFATNYLDYSVGFFGWGEVANGLLEGDLIYAGISLPQIRGLPLQDPNALRDDDPPVENYVQLSVLGGIYKYLADETFLEASLNFNKLIVGSKTPYTIASNLRWHYRNWAWIGAGAKFPIIRQNENLEGQTFEEIVNENRSGALRNLSEYSVSTLLFEVGFNVGSNIRDVWDQMNLKIGIGYEVPIGGLLASLGNTIELNVTYTMDTRPGRR